MNVSIQTLPFEPTALNGLSERLLRSHHENNYAGAVKRLNAIRAQLRGVAFASTPGFQINGLKREELIAANSVVLHELYFESLGGGTDQVMAPAMALALAASFDSVERWRDEFVAMGKALGGGSGWALLSFQPRDGTLVNQWASDHAHVLAGAIPILALDMYEHAYQIDFGAAAARYVDVFMENIDWSKVHERYQAAVIQSSEALGASPDELGAALLLDLRRAEVFAQAEALIEGAQWRDPVQIESWARQLPSKKDVVVYCAHGLEIGRLAAMRLRASGVHARFLRGGYDEWSAAGRPLSRKKRRG